MRPPVETAFFAVSLYVSLSSLRLLALALAIGAPANLLICAEEHGETNWLLVSNREGGRGAQADRDSIGRPSIKRSGIDPCDPIAERDAEREKFCAKIEKEKKKQKKKNKNGGGGTKYIYVLPL